MERKFTHLHLHTPYSLLDGFATIEDTIKKAKEDGMDAVAITDHGVMFGVVEFYKVALNYGIKPIIGCEVYVSYRTRFDKENIDKRSYHLILLAENNTGYQNLIKLVSLGFVEGYYYKPRVDIDLLKSYSEGIIALSACLAGEVQQSLLNNNYEEAKKVACRYREIFGEDNFFLELQNHGIEEQLKVNHLLRRLSLDTGIPLVATNDVHYVNRSDSKNHDILLCIQTGKTLDDKDRMEFKTDQFYFKTREEMYQLFSKDEDALLNTWKISQRCNVSFDFNVIHLPEFQVPHHYTKEQIFDELCERGLQERYFDITPPIRERFEYEKKVIKKMGYVEYFLIVQDFIRFSKKNNIMVGPGRGSAAGSIISYCLQITDVDPIKYHLLFERFLNPERISMPDIDIDFCYEKREQVIDYVKEKYGEDHVAQIITFGTFGAKAAIRDVGRVLGISYAEVDKIAKQIPDNLGMTIEKALEMNSELKKMYVSDNNVRNIIDFAKRIEGLPRHASTHAAGIVISKNTMDYYVPLYMHKDLIATQFPMTTLEELGLLKMDFLGLRTLTVIQKTLEAIEKIYNKKIDFSKMDTNNTRVFQLLSNGNTLGVFQLESPGMRSFLKELRPDTFEDIVAGISLYRPGPMESIPIYIENKNNSNHISYLHESLKPILEVTKGIMVYQEQVMQIVRSLAGYSYARADLVRKAMSKKKMDVMEEEREYFVYGKISGSGDIEISGCVRNGIPEKIANQIYDEMIDFAKYAFNKSHAVCYAMLAYETAYLKAFYPSCFMASLMTSVSDRSDKVIEYIRECADLNICILKPDINRSNSYFSVEGDHIRYALASIKNIGIKAIDDIVQERNKNGEFQSFEDFIKRIPQKNISKRFVESLIKAGCFDSIHPNRASLVAGYEKVMDIVHSQKKHSIQGQVTLFSNQEALPNQNLNFFPHISDFSIKEKLYMEKETIGLYLSGHPLDEYQDVIKDDTNIVSIDSIKNIPSHQKSEIEKKKIVIAGTILSKMIKYTKQNKIMCFLTIEDFSGSLEVLIFPNVFQKNLEFLNEDECILIYGSMQWKEENDVTFIADRIEPLKTRKFKKIYIQLTQENSYRLNEIQTFIKKYPGKDHVIFFDSDSRKAFEMQGFHRIEYGSDIIDKLKIIAGRDNVKTKM